MNILKPIEKLRTWVSDYELWGSYSSLVVVRDEPVVKEREFSAGFGKIWTPRGLEDELISGMMEQVMVDAGAYSDGVASLYINGMEALAIPFTLGGKQRIPLGIPHSLTPGDKWKWVVEAPSITSDRQVGVDVLVGIRTFWKSNPEECLE